jgi:chromosomal replication initiation ATPase DnaA
MKELTRQCLGLTKKNRKRLIKILQDSLIKTEDDGSRFHILLSIAESISGNGIMSQRRDLNLVVGRRMIAHQMRREGYSLPFIGKCLRKHHTTVIHMLKMWDDAMYFEFNLELSYWEQFQKKLKEIDNAN